MSIKDHIMLGLYEQVFIMYWCIRGIVVPSWLTCVVLSGYFSCKVYIDLNLCDTLEYEWWLVATPKRSNRTSFMIHMYIEIDVDDYNYLYQILFGNTCMLSVGCRPMMLSTLIWLKLDWKWLKLDASGLWVFAIWSLGCLELGPLGLDRSVLLSVVTQALL
jgi:hypothetical protein